MAHETRPGPELRGFQRRWLRGSAHALRPVVQVGDEGVSEGVVRALDQALLDHELVKVRLQKPGDKKSTAAELAHAARAHLCGVVGHTVILYRAHPETPKLVLPERE
jgi:RNA-binding protein